jgi:hypothetical protein
MEHIRNCMRDGDFVVPWGRKGIVPAYIMESTMAKEGMSVSARFYEWCEEQVTSFMAVDKSITHGEEEEYTFKK